MITKDIYSVNLPDEVKNWKVEKSAVLAIKNIPEEAGLYSGLNRSLVRRLPRGTVASRRKVDLVSRDFVRDENNRYVYEDVKVPSGSIVIISDRNLNLPFNYKCGMDGFGYVDFISNGTGREYMYIVPKMYLYATHQTALALSVKNMRNFSGMGYVSWKFGTIFLHIIPYNPNAKYVGTRILKTSHKLDYTKEVKCIVDYWIMNNIIPNPVVCETVSYGNLVLKPTARGYDDFDPMEELSLGDKEIYGESDAVDITVGEE